MTYVLSDLHGNYEKFKKMLQKIDFGDHDILYILGDFVDYGDGAMELIGDVSLRLNVYPVAGEHDYRAAKMLSGFDKMLKSGGTPDPAFISEMTAWVADGGQVTLDAFRALDADSREGVLDYLGDLPLFEETEVNGKNYVMVHEGIAGYDPDGDLDEMDLDAFFSKPCDPKKETVPGSVLIVGHTPTASGKIEYGKGSIFLDCGVANGGKLGCLCLESGEEFYV